LWILPDARRIPQSRRTLDTQRILNARRLHDARRIPEPPMLDDYPILDECPCSTNGHARQTPMFDEYQVLDEHPVLENTRCSTRVTDSLVDTSSVLPAPPGHVHWFRPDLTRPSISIYSTLPISITRSRRCLNSSPSDMPYLLNQHEQLSVHADLMSTAPVRPYGESIDTRTRCVYQYRSMVVWKLLTDV